MKYDAKSLSRLQKWYEKKGWSKREFAKRMDVHESNISKYMDGRLDLANLEVALLREGMDLHWLQTGKKAQSSESQAMLEMLHSMGIETPEQLANFLSPETIVEDIRKTVEASFARRIRK